MLEKQQSIYFGSTLNIFDPPKLETYKFPSVSIVRPSGKKPGLLPFKLKSIRTRSLAKNGKKDFYIYLRAKSKFTHKYRQCLDPNRILSHHICTSRCNTTYLSLDSMPNRLIRKCCSPIHIHRRL